MCQIGEVFGSWVVIECLGMVDCGNRRYRKVVCRCECGVEQSIRVCNLKGGKANKCRSCSKRIHGLSKSRVRNIWKLMIYRTTNPSCPGWNNYGGRGISVCERWLSLTNFHEDMGVPEPGMSIERVDNDGDYCPENCIWADPKTQCRNTRRNVILTDNYGESHCVARWSEITGTRDKTIHSRLKRGFSEHDAIWGNERTKV